MSRERHRGLAHRAQRRVEPREDHDEADRHGESRLHRDRAERRRIPPDVLRWGRRPSAGLDEGMTGADRAETQPRTLLRRVFAGIIRARWFVLAVYVVLVPVTAFQALK